MCGIIGYYGGGKGLANVGEGLKRLEYRGYDSWGVAWKDEDNNIIITKKIGKIGDERFSNEDISIAIGHTRWATHGEVIDKNAHPHISMNGKIVVVHNGIVENYQELKNFLEERGFKFISSTDTEVIPNLIQYFLEQNLSIKDAFREALLKLEGSYAVVAAIKDYNGLLFSRRGSPLVLGIGDKEMFVASDVPAFLEHTNTVIYLDDNEYGMLYQGWEIYDIKTNSRIMKEQQTIDWGIEEAKKGNYPHFMLKEIYEQSSTIKKAVEQDKVLIEKLTKMINEAVGIFFIGCGTSYHACVSGTYMFSHIAKKHVNAVLASEFRNYEEFLTKNTLVIALSQSGETADVLDAVKVAKQKGTKVIAITNVMGSTLTRLSDETIMMNAGPEICVLSTKSYTSQLAIILLLAYSSVGRLDEGKNLIKKTAELSDEIIKNNENALKMVARETKDKKDYFLIGRDLAYPSALEGALKIKEVSYIHAEGFAGGELKHGTIALIERGTPVIVLSTKDTRIMIRSNATEIKSRGGFIIGIDSENNSVYDVFIKVPELGYANPIAMIIPIQLIAYYLALERNCDPDRPRNLAKSVTVR